jgi:hypothetical protein
MSNKLSKNYSLRSSLYGGIKASGDILDRLLCKLVLKFQINGNENHISQSTG